MKVIIVEDETTIREGIIESLDWEEEGFEKPVGFASAIEAVSYLEKEEVELMITDLYMPVITGLELIRLLREYGLDTEVLILTGHDRFELAQEAISLSVKRYLLKPVSAQQLQEAVRQIRDEIIEKRQLKDWISIAKEKLDKYLPVIVNQFWNDVVHGEGLELADILARAKEAQIYMEYGQFVCLAVATKKSQAQPLTVRLAARQIIERMLREELIYLLEADGMQLAILSCELSEEKMALLQKSLDGNLNLHTAIGTSLVKHTPTLLQSAWGEALEAAKTCLALPGSSRMQYRDMEAWKEKTSEYPYEQESRILEMIRFRDEAEESVIAAFIKSVMPPQNRVEDAKLMLLQLLVTVSRLSNEYGLNSYEEYKKAEKCIEGEEFEAMGEIFLSMIRRIIQDKNKSRQRYVEIMVEKAKEMMQNEYGNSQLNVKLLADRIGVTPNYLSRVFSENMQITCIEYLTAIRMEAAKKLLLHTDRKSYCIGVEVGYLNANYFSALFKKYAGVSPKEFRREQV